MLYTSTSNGCGGVANGVWAITLDPKNKTVSSWKTNGGSPVGNLAFTAGGKILVAIGPGTTTAGGYANAIVALDAKTLQPLDWFTSPSAAVRDDTGRHQSRRSRDRRRRDARRHLPPRRRFARRRQSLDAALRHADGRTSSRTRWPHSSSLLALPGCSCLARAESSRSGLWMRAVKRASSADGRRGILSHRRRRLSSTTSSSPHRAAVPRDRRCCMRSTRDRVVSSGTAERR